MQILIVVQVQISFIGRFDFLTKPLPIVLDFDQFSDVMYETTGVRLIRIFIPSDITKNGRCHGNTQAVLPQRYELEAAREINIFHQVKYGNIQGNALAFSKPILCKASSVEVMRGSSGSTN